MNKLRLPWITIFSEAERKFENSKIFFQRRRIASITKADLLVKKKHFNLKTLETLQGWCKKCVNDLE